MTPDDACDLCALAEDRENLILETASWRTFLSHNQDRLGRCLTVAKEHRRAIIELTVEELTDWQEHLHLLHPALYKAFGPTHINVTCLMNGAFEHAPPHPHVHWWSIPRYDRPVTVEDTVFTDHAYPNQTAETMDLPEQERRVSPLVQKEIKERIQREL